MFSVVVTRCRSATISSRGRRGLLATRVWLVQQEIRRGRVELSLCGRAVMLARCGSVVVTVAAVERLW